MADVGSSRQIDHVRSEAARYEDSLEPRRRKALGQFFTGLPLSRVLAAIALDDEATTIIDPMAGHGDLLDAVAERAVRNGRKIERLQAIEIDHPTARLCRERLECWQKNVGEVLIEAGDAFDPGTARTYLNKGYDLVITNPPYVRYQTLAVRNGDIPQLSPKAIRRRLWDVVERRIGAEESAVWRTVIEEYSGLADLSVPAWILCAALVRPGGMLALVAPATWRSRDYGDVIEYLLARCFRLEYLIEDTQPGWFSDALVRTQLVIARRLTAAEARVPLSERTTSKAAVVTVKVSPSASASGSLVNVPFPNDDPEREFATWLHKIRHGERADAPGLVAEVEPLGGVAERAMNSARRRSWFRKLEPRGVAGSLFERKKQTPLSIVPPAVRSLFGEVKPANLVLLDTVGLSISQGLRTGCNGFFYADEIGQEGNAARIRVSSFFGGEEFTVPKGCLRPVVRRQSEVAGPVVTTQLWGRVLDLTDWVLPEDAEQVERAKHLYARAGIPVPQVMPSALAGFVRRAATTLYGSGHEAKRTCELSAVKTNVRPQGSNPPRFWYMLPPFARRHLPDAFVARINQTVPWVEINDDPPVLIDANFSTIWSEKACSNWTRFAVRAFLNSAWCQACMEALGTPLGGGALKLEAAQLRRLPVPILTATDLAMLDGEGRALPSLGTSVSESLNGFLLARITGLPESDPKIGSLLKGLRATSDSLCRARQRK